MAQREEIITLSDSEGDTMPGLVRSVEQMYSKSHRLLSNQICDFSEFSERVEKQLKIVELEVEALRDIFTAFERESINKYANQTVFAEQDRKNLFENLLTFG